MCNLSVDIIFNIFNYVSYIEASKLKHVSVLFSYLVKTHKWNDLKTRIKNINKWKKKIP